MSRETWEIVQESGIKNVEIQLALQCAPLIAGLKISNLFQISIEDYIQVLKILKNSRIMIYPLGVKGNTIALLLYRKRSLEGYLDQEKVKELLKEFGYSCTSLKEILVTFRKLRLRSCPGYRSARSAAAPAAMTRRSCWRTPWRRSWSFPARRRCRKFATIPRSRPSGTPPRGAPMCSALTAPFLPNALQDAASC